MNKSRSTRIFKSGNSKALRIPGEWAVEPEQDVVVREEAGRHLIGPVDGKIDLTGIAGSMPGLKLLAPNDR